MHPVAEPPHHPRQVVVRPRAERARAERDAVRRVVDRRHRASRVVGLGRHDPRQAEQGERRIVRMAAEPHADLRGGRHDLLEKGEEMLRSRSRRDRRRTRRGGRAMPSSVRLSAAPGRPKATLRAKRPCACLVHRGEAPAGLLAHLDADSPRSPPGAPGYACRRPRSPPGRSACRCRHAPADRQDRCGSSRAPA